MSMGGQAFQLLDLFFFVSKVLVFMDNVRKNEIACNDLKVSTRKKRNVQMSDKCEGETTIKSRTASKAFVVQIKREPMDLVAPSTSVCKDSLAGFDLLQLEEDYQEYDGSK